MNIQENLLHYIWQYQKFTTTNLKTESGYTLQIVNVGTHNKHAGPDFFNAQLLINNQKWAGNVEIHLKASDWYAHHHENDVAYKTIILHVVWEDDVAVFDNNNNQIETVVLKNRVDKTLLKNYQQLLQQKSWIPCENNIHTIDDFIWIFWKEKLIINRLQRKIADLEVLLSENNNNWEELLFVLLAKNFGLKINQNQFLQLAQSISFSVFKKEIPNMLSLESLLLGQANLLADSKEDGYYQQLQTEYEYVKQKHKLQDNLIKLNFFGLRPVSFPTIRLSQFANLYHQNSTLFAKVIQIKTLAAAQKIFTVTANQYWDTHYTFGKTSAKRKKKISNSFVALLVINVIIPLQYKYAKSLGKDNIEAILKLYESIGSEKNGIINKFATLKVKAVSALDSQSLIELKNEYCVKRKCLQCQIGHQLLYQKRK